MHMKFGVNTWVWTAPLTTEELEVLAPKIASMGFDHIEIPMDDPKTLDPNVRQNGVDYLKASIDGLALIGGKNMVGPFYSAVGRTWQQTAEEREHDMLILIDILKDLSEYASQKGVVLGLEPLNRFETSFITTADQALELVNRVDHPACKIMLDTFHMNIEENSMGDAIRKVGSCLIQVHSNENNRGTPGAGHVPWQEVAQALKDINYDGVLVIESFTNKVKSIARAAAIWRPLASSQDALAADGVVFLRELLN
jgi:D-psicose/D-tagatose/L-ribulose 3-epimerase